MTQATTLSAGQMWRDYPRETLVLAVLGLAASAAFAGASWSTPTLGDSGEEQALRVAPPPAPPMLVRQLAPEDALQINGGIPLASGPNPAARPFLLKAAGATHARALECLTSAVYYEAGNESDAGQRAVAQVILNRVRHPAFPSNVCGVVYQGSTRETGCQFTFTCDGSLMRRPSVAGWARARKVAEAALAGAVFAPVGYATHYHANYVVPYWASSLAKNAVVGAHIFYRWAGGWGRPPAFASRYAGVEPDVGSLKSAALAAEVATDNEPVETVEAEEVVAEIPGAEAKEVLDGRVGVRFNLEARKAVEETPHHEYVDKFKASDNLRWSLSGDIVKDSEQPLGKAKPAAAVVGGSAAGAAAQ